MTRPGRGLGKDVWLPILLLSSMHWPAVDHWNLLFPWQSLTCKGNEAESPWASQVSPRSSSFPGDPPSSWEMPLPWGRPCSPLPASWQVGPGERGLLSLDMILQQWISRERDFTVPPTPALPLASYELNVHMPPAPWSAGLNPKSIQNLGTEIWEWKEEMDLCKRPWLAQGGEDKESVTGCQKEGLPMLSMVTNPTLAECIRKEAWDKVTLQWHRLTSVPLGTTSGWAGTLTQLCVSSEQLLSDCTVMLKTCKLCMRLASD